MNTDKLDTSKIRIGTMLNSLRTKENELLKIFFRAYELGIKNIDISPSYISGESIKLTSKVINSLNKSDFRIHTKVGSAYKKNLLKGYIYLSDENINESLDIVCNLFPNNKIETVLIHLKSSKKIIFNALNILNKYKLEGKFKYIGVCDFEDFYLNQFIKKYKIKDFYIQKRYCLGIINSPNLLKNCNYIGYGLLNAGSFLKNSDTFNSRIQNALDAPEIRSRNLLITNNIKFEFIKEKCRANNIFLVDYCIASPLLNGYEKIIMGPTKVDHLDPIERMLDKGYWNRIKQLNLQISHFK